MNKRLNKNTKKNLTHVKLSGMTNEVTVDSDVTCDPFPFTEENNKSFEHTEYGELP